jgi:hypothetical protein
MNEEFNKDTEIQKKIKIKLATNKKKTQLKAILIDWIKLRLECQVLNRQMC